MHAYAYTESSLNSCIVLLCDVKHTAFVMILVLARYIASYRLSQY